MKTAPLTRFRSLAAAALMSVAGLSLSTGMATAEVTAFKQAIAETAAQDDALSAFYRDNGYQPIWVGDDEDDLNRRAALLKVLEVAGEHGLPADRYRPEDVRAMLASARSTRDRGRIEVEMSRLFLRFATDKNTGILNPNKVVSGIKREVPVRDRLQMLKDFETSLPLAYLRGLTPTSPEYTRLVREKLKLEQQIEQGGWGAQVNAGSLKPGDQGQQVVALRDRLIALDYLRRSATQVYDDEMQGAVAEFQRDNGLTDDGIAGSSTIEKINIGPEARMGQIMVALERERWMNIDRGKRHIWVNLTDFKAKIIDDGEVTFETRSVIGKDVPDRETPEFSDVMNHMVINPSWYIPRSIIVNEYLPVLRSNPHALSYLEITDSRGRVVNRGRGFSQYSARTFPYSMRQPPSARNALGLVKFMFPNKYNIYLHDTPAKNLFSRERRAFSHGCIRLADPFDFAYALLAKQSDDPKATFHNYLNTGRETRVNLEQPVPVHLVYRTAYTKPAGGMEYRRDVYGRDADILAALRAAGVEIPRTGS
ncbi:L,D-transpeptidase family protein [Oceaniglobus ichthyenteri]|uniref:L,D-transpeptidase family protein n=1 Tax=Oceaniglobus ichthyenteri TaxID=2136177 RepID=UPI000D3403CB|nr:L,D-transpeptidase family protein [Oceaniglobus ichthyenteri]